MIGSIRHHVRIRRSVDDVWALAGDPARLHEWFPGIVASTVDGSTRVITTGAGMPMPEEILVNDPTQRRFQYRLAVPLIQFHRGTIDALDLGDGTCVVTYQTDADPRTMALVIGGGTAGALRELQRQMESPAAADASIATEA